MTASPQDTAERLLAATSRVICAARRPGDVTARAIAAEAGTSVSAISYHFGSLEDLVVATAARLYVEVNAERMALLEAAQRKAAPHPPGLREVIAALIGPPVRWSLDPAKPYAVFRHVEAMQGTSDTPTRLNLLIDRIEQHRAFIDVLRRAAPWLDRVEVGWRVNAALGIRSQVLRNARRTRLLTQGTLDLSDPDTAIDLMVDVIVPMFAPQVPGSGPPAAPVVRRNG